MAREVITRLLGDDPELIATFGVDRDRVLWEYTFDIVPVSGWFLLTRFDGVQRRRGGGRIRLLTVQAHRKRSETIDYTAVDALLARVRTVLVTATPTVGVDGRFTAARHTSTGRDTYDMAYSTIAGSATFEVAAGIPTDDAEVLTHGA